jgi:trehalose 6-phosphate phosphatase
MQHLFNAWADFTAGIRAAAHVIVLSDYDGTLTPIMGRPQDAVLSEEAQHRLSDLSEKQGYSVGIISGRSIDEVKSMVGLEGIYYSGNHGLEIEGPGLKYSYQPAEQARAMMQELGAALAVALENISGVIVQEKGLSLSVHYRLVPEIQQDNVVEIFRRLTATLEQQGEITVFAGKKVLEVKPPLDWDKGKAVEIIISRLKDKLKTENILAVFLGDDTTDEDAFKMLHYPHGWSVFIGGESTSSAADYYLDSVAQVQEFLDRLIDLN